MDAKVITIKQDEVEGFENVRISEKTIDRILSELQVFENGTDFLSKNFTISRLAIDLSTNTKTLSIVIKNYKNNNFNSYINQLRVYYFMDKVEEDDEFRKYKLSYISEVLGYSSSTAFSNAFKNVTGLLPSVYLKNLSE